MFTTKTRRQILRVLVPWWSACRVNGRTSWDRREKSVSHQGVNLL